MRARSPWSSFCGKIPLFRGILIFRYAKVISFCLLFSLLAFGPSLHSKSIVKRSAISSSVSNDYSISSIVQLESHSLPKVAIIIDDAGENLDLLEHLVELPFSVTVSVIPGTPHDAESAGWSKRHGLEVMVHLPMEPEAYPEKDPGKNAILTSMSSRKLREKTLDLIEEIPYASGVNNHMGSRFTQSAVKMNPVLDMIARNQLYFVDSRTTPYSTAFQVAQLKKIPSAERDLFLDDDPQQIMDRF
ncbi:MAG TPA: divergent polysaccharide deacetylase family protein, partial [Acidobacteriota bacterium]